jgi:hypothetical protein
VSKGGIKGWLARNKGKKADPETLAWLRGEEAAEGRAAYAGWADREDGNILEWHKEQKAGAAGAAAETDVAAEVGSVTAPAAATERAGAEPATGVAAVTPAVGGLSLSGAEPATGVAAVTPAVGGLSPASSVADVAPVVRRPSLPTLGAAAVAALRAPPAILASELAALLASKVPALATAGTQAVTGERTLAVVLIGDRVFDDLGRSTALVPASKRMLRDIVALLQAHPRYTIRIASTEDRGMEIAATLVIAGLASERVEVVIKPFDLAIDTVELTLAGDP